MLIVILQSTPVWVWGILAALIAWGLSQTRVRQVSLLRVTLVPLALCVFSLRGVLDTFGKDPSTLIEWLAGVVVAATALGKVVAVRGAVWSPSTLRFTLPGSLVPMTLLVGVFVLRYTVGVALALHSEWAGEARFAGVCTLAYGGFAGLFWARARSLRQLRRSSGQLMEQNPSLR